MNLEDLFSLKGRVALVTGGSRGIGKMIVEGFLAAGIERVYISARKIHEIEETCAELGDKVIGIQGDLSTIEGIEALVEELSGRESQLDILVNNAATNPYYGPMMDVDKGRYDKTFQVNLDAPIFWTQAAYEHALKDKPGVVINIASVGGLRAEGGLGVYNLTKAAVIHLTRQLASEIGPNRVVGIAPGLVQTDFAAYLVDNFGDSLAARLPLERLGDPQDIANLAVFLASDMASWITGETYVIDGGAGVASSGV